MPSTYNTNVFSNSGHNKGSLYRLALIVVCSFFTSAAMAVIISPVKVELSTDQSVVTITVTNDADLPLTIQNQVLAWTQVDGEDHLQESTDLLVAPAIAEIKPRGVQIFRVTQRRPTVAITERAYRLILDDISTAQRQPQVNGVNLVISHRLPVFVAGAGKMGPKPQLVQCLNITEQKCVRLENNGDQYVQVRTLWVSGRNWQEELGSGSRVLAGAWKQWTFSMPPASAGGLTITAETSAGRMSIELLNPNPLSIGSVSYEPD